MVPPKEWRPGDKITMTRLNQTNVEASRARRSAAIGAGSAIVNEQMANQSTNHPIAQIVLVVATEDFEVQRTDLKAVDSAKSGTCQIIRLDRQTGEYCDSRLQREFRVYDVIGYLNNTQAIQAGECFYAVWNMDSHRWECLGRTGVEVMVARVVRCMGKGWHEIELCSWAGRPTFDYGSGNTDVSLSGSSSESDSESCYNNTESYNYSQCRMDCVVEPCNTLDDGNIPMDECLQAGEQFHYPVYAHTSRQLPMLTGGFIKVMRRFGTPQDQISRSDSTSASASEETGPFLCTSASDSTDDLPWYFDVIDGCWAVHEIDVSDYAVCRDTATQECRVITTTQRRLLVEGYLCDGVPLESCGGLESTSQSAA